MSKAGKFGPAGMMPSKLAKSEVDDKKHASHNANSGMMPDRKKWAKEVASHEDIYGSENAGRVAGSAKVGATGHECPSTMHREDYGNHGPE